MCNQCRATTNHQCNSLEMTKEGLVSQEQYE
jgi:hypothetical protein